MKIILFILFLFSYKINCEIKGCSEYDSNGKCTYCQLGYKLIKGKCMHIDSCLEYDENGCIECSWAELQENGTCKYCGFTMDVFGKKCIPEVEHCAYNFGTVQMPCLKCDNNYTITEEGTKCVPCESGKVSAGFQCVSKLGIDHCSQIDSIKILDYACSMCESGYSLSMDGKKCTKCNENEVAPFGECVKAIENCETYSKNGKCESCYNNYPLNSDKTVCASSGISKCLEYNEDSTCKTCSPYYKLNEIKTSCSMCTSPGTNDNEGNFCFGIDQCDQYEEDLLHCKLCKENYKLSEDKKTCSKCESRKISDGLSCYEDLENCASSYVKNKEVLCRICYSGYNLTTNKKQCTTCDKGKYLYNGNCIDEIKGCLYYSSQTTCSKCSSDYILSKGKCERCVD